MKLIKNLIAWGLVIVSIFIISGCYGSHDDLVFSRLKADAGPNQSITAPSSTVTLSGKGYFDVADWRYRLAAKWTQLSGPTATIVRPQGQTLNADTIRWETLVTGLTGSTVPIEYVFQLMVSSPDAYDKDTAYDEVTITVLPVSTVNQLPTADAGHDITVVLQPSSVDVTLMGSGTDPEGGPLSYSWTQLSGPTTVHISITNPPNAARIHFDTYGDWVFRLTVTDHLGGTATDDVTVKVTSTANTFQISTNIYTAQQPLRNFNTFHVTDMSQTYMLTFYFYGQQAFPAIGITKSYQVINTIPSVDNKVWVRAVNGTQQLEYLTTGTDNVTATMENRNGKIYLTLPEAITKRNSGPDTDTLHISAKVHEY